MAVALLVLLVLAVLVVTLLNRPVGARYPNRLEIGSIVIEFSKIDRLCYAVAAAAVLIGVVAGLLLIWGPRNQDMVGKVLATAAVGFLGAVFILVLNRLMRGPRGAAS